jgi:hypothetical protein
MERTTSIEEANEIMGNNFIGPADLLNNDKISNLFFINTNEIPTIPYTINELNSVKKSHILILVLDEFRDRNKISLSKLKQFFGFNPEEKEPCFYNQDWYLNEPFYNDSKLKLSWVLFSIEILETTRSIDPNLIFKNTEIKTLPSALLATYCFFILYFIKNIIFLKYDYLWCNDYDSNGDRIYVGRYIDPNKKNKNGFSIHRHLSIKSNYGAINFLIN